MTRAFALVGFVAVSLLVVACGDKPKPNPTIPTQAASSGAPPSASARQAALNAASDAGVDLPPLKPIEVTENDFVESDRNRDPFRSFASSFVSQGPTPAAANQRTVLLNDYSLDELKLVAIVLSGDYPRAMLVDPTGKGWVVKRGDFVGRADIVRLGGANGAEYQLNWRVDRVRDGDVVLIREDPAQPAIPAATKVVPLHTEKDEQAKNP